MRRPDLILLLVILALVAFGALMVTSASSVAGIDLREDPYVFARHQLLYGVLPGLIVLVVMMFIPYRLLRLVVVPFLALVLLLLLLVFVPGFRFAAGGAARWVRFGTLTIQPSELAKLALTLYLAALLAGREVRVGRARETLVPFLSVVGAVVILLAAQPDIGTLVVLAATALLTYAVAGAPWSHLFGIGVLSVAGLFAIIEAAPYRVARVLTFFRPEADPKGIGYHVQQALLAVGSGGMWGLGFGRSRQKFQYLPEPATDAIFAVAAEELGFLRMVLVLLLYLVVILRGYRIAQRAPDTFGRLVAAGVTSWFFVQIMIHISANTGLLPLTGVPLPLVSYGGSALVTTLAGAGILLNISRGAGGRHV